MAVVTKAAAEEGCTQYAQGGVCAVLDTADSAESHIRDTFVAGCFLNNLGWGCLQLSLMAHSKQMGLFEQHLSHALLGDACLGVSASNSMVELMRMQSKSFHRTDTELLFARTTAGLWRRCAGRAQRRCWSWWPWAPSSRVGLTAACT